MTCCSHRRSSRCLRAQSIAQCRWLSLCPTAQAFCLLMLSRAFHLPE